MLYFLIWLLIHIVVESFPLSSSGHVYLLELFCNQQCMSLNGFYFFNMQMLSDFLHGISACVIACFFYQPWMYLLRTCLFNWHCAWPFIVFIGIADSCTTVLFFIFKLIGKQFFPLPLGFFITAVALLVISKNKSNESDGDLYGVLTIKNAFILGIIQGICLLPGISRFGLTYATGRFLNMNHAHAFFISFMIQWPLLIAAATKGSIALYTAGSFEHLLHPAIVFVTLLSAVCAYYALVLSEYMLRIQKGWIFSIYLIIPLVVTIWYGY